MLYQGVFSQIGVRPILKKMWQIPGNSKILEKYLWMDSGLIKMQFFLMLFIFTGKMKLIKLLHWYLSSFSWSFCDNSYSAELFSDAYLKPSRKSRMEFFLAKIVNVNYFRKKATSLNVRLNSKYASASW